MPLIMILLGAAPTLIMQFSETESHNIMVVDESGIVAPQLTSDDIVTFKLSDQDLAASLITMSSDKECFGVLHIGKEVVSNTNDVRLYTSSSSSLMLEESITSQIEKIIESERLKGYNIENLDDILAKVKASVHLTTINKEEAVSSTIASSITGMVLGFLLYFLLAIYGGMVMSSVIEEKNSRILEVMVSSVRPFEMLMGKIIGIALVAATQILVWGVLLVLFSAILMPMLMSESLIEGVKLAQAGADISALAAQQDVAPELITALASILDTGHIVMIIGVMLLFAIGGFLLYASLYAAVGASVDQAQDAQQLTIIITAPIIISFIVTMMIVKDPNSPVVQWCSMIPFTAPIVMVARIPGEVPTWEILTSLVLLYATFVVCVWGAAKIYRIGIFMHGSKPKLKDLWQWLRY